jgi:hypothetical protein
MRYDEPRLSQCLIFSVAGSLGFIANQNRHKNPGPRLNKQALTRFCVCVCVAAASPAGESWKDLNAEFVVR